ncbi:MAG: hypothetical protein K2N70_01510, partial [Helicobacter sp.]|nr:hypothetical protein [Helicobacter sp.]
MPIFHSAASMLCLWLEHRRCALWLGRSTMSNGRIDRFHCHCERAARAWQSTGKESQHIERSNTVDCFG